MAVYSFKRSNQEKLKINSVCLLVLLLSAALWATDRPVLRFVDGTFKIVQFTDIHFQYNSFRSDSAMVIVKTVIAREKPALVVLTGDIVCSKDTRKAWLSLAQALIDCRVPWAVMLGNHDAQYDLTKEEILATIAGLPYNLTENGPKEVCGNGNYVLQVQSGDEKGAAALVYCLDSHMGFHPKTDLGDYEWFDFTQIVWYREQSEKFKQENEGRPLPALAFFHIPLPEYNEVLGKRTTVGLQQETVCSPAVNAGMYAAMLECKDVMGIFVGHDHNNNYIGCLRNICLAYGQVTGRQCYGKIGRGARVIVMYEGQRKFDTWVLKLYECDRDKDIWHRAADQEPLFFTSYPDSFR